MTHPPNPESHSLVKALDRCRSALITSIQHTEPSVADLKKVRACIQKLTTALTAYDATLDPIQQPDYVFDPSDPKYMGRLIAITMLKQPKVALDALPRFYGSGVYALYYKGAFSAYQPISGTEIPIYVGKVDPKSAEAATPQEQGDKLWFRLLKDHAKNIKLATSTLDVHDFECRFLVVKSAWQNTAETYLINHFQPVWNNEMKVCFGIGKHGDNAKTRQNKRSPWDEIHPGRKWAAGNEPRPGGVEAVLQAVADHFKQLDLVRIADVANAF